MSDVIYSIRYVCRYARVASWHSSQPPPVLQREKCRENDVGLYLFHVFSLPSFHPPFSYSPYPSAPLTRASYHPPSTLRRGHRVIRPLALPLPPCDPFRVRPQIDVLFLSIKIDCGSASICVVLAITSHDSFLFATE